MKYFVSSIMLVVALFAPMAPVAAGTIPEFNPVCWQKKKCFETRAQIVYRVGYDTLSSADKQFVEDGFKAGKDDCVGGVDDQQWGMCLPGGAANTTIAFGGKRQFTDIGDFIQTNYSYILTLAAILAVIMIVVAGFQWVTSGGNSESISSAKNRISGAVIGLFIAYTSYFILNTINPYLVNLQLPQTWMVRPQSLTSQFCNQAPPKTKFSFASSFEDQISKAATPSSSIQYQVTTPADLSSNKFYCGHRFFMEGSGSGTCYGSFCGPNTSCVLLAENDLAKQQNSKLRFGCKTGQLFMHLAITDLAEQAKKSFFGNSAGSLDSANWLDDAYRLYSVCKYRSTGGLVIGGSKEVSVESRGETKGPLYAYDIVLGHMDEDQGRWGCPTGSDLVGFFFTNEFGVNWNPVNDARFIVGYRGAEAVVGVWNEHVTVQDYFPLSLLTTQGISVNVGLSAKVIEAVVAKKGSEPSN